MVKHNNIIPNVHLRKHWSRQKNHTHHDQPAAKLRRYRRRQDKAAKMFPRPIQKLRPVVASQTRRYAGKVRYGRGFSLLELKSAGLSATFARTVGISVDHRRTNGNDASLQLNVERLNTYKNKLVLWPRVEGKPKKGEINDSTAEQLKSAAAQTQPSGKVLPRGRPEQAVETVKITADLQKVNPYNKTRTLRTIKHYNGRRIKRAEDAEAEAKDK